MSLGNSVILGVTAGFGALVPPISCSLFPTEGKFSFRDMLSNSDGQLVLFGVAVCHTGIAVSGRAGMMKEREISQEDKIKSIKDFSLVKGFEFFKMKVILLSLFAAFLLSLNGS